MKKLGALLTSVVLGISVLVGCGDSTATSGKMDKFVIAFLPQESDEQAQRTNKDFHEKLSAAIGIPVETYQATSYNAAIEAMKNNKADLTMFGPFSYIVAVERAKVEPIIGISLPALADKPASVILVAKDSPIQTLADLKGKTMGFVDPVSTTGHLFPKAAIIKELGLKPEELDKGFFKSIQFAGKHDNAVIGVVRGQYDAAAASAMYPAILEQKGIIEKDSYRIIATTGSAPSTPFAVRGSVSQEIKEKLKEFFLTYDNPEFFKSMMGSPDAKFIEVKDSDYDYVRDTAKLLNLSPEELLKQ